MRKVNIVLVVFVVVFLGLNIAQYLWWNNINKETAEKYTAELANLQAQLDSIGSRVEVYTVGTAKKAGDMIEASDIETLWTYSTLITDQYVTNVDDIVGRFYKIAVNPGTAITKNMVMDEELIDSMRDRDIVLDRMTVGLHEGDYIDIRITMPYGDDYVVLSHKRVYGINDSTVKLHLTELEWNTYLGAQIDYYLNAAYGCTMYADKYVEPGLQQDAIRFYAVPDNIAALLQKNPNIVDKTEAASLNEWRNSIEELLVIFRDTEDTIDSDGSTIAAGRGQFNSDVEADREAIRTEEIEEEKQKAEMEAEFGTDDGTGMEGGEDVGDDFWDDP